MAGPDFTPTFGGGAVVVSLQNRTPAGPAGGWADRSPTLEATHHDTASKVGETPIMIH